MAEPSLLYDPLTAGRAASRTSPPPRATQSRASGASASRATWRLVLALGKLDYLAASAFADQLRDDWEADTGKLAGPADGATPV